MVIQHVWFRSHNSSPWHYNEPVLSSDNNFTYFDSQFNGDNSQMVCFGVKRGKPCTSTTCTFEKRIPWLTDTICEAIKILLLVVLLFHTSRWCCGDISLEFFSDSGSSVEFGGTSQYMVRAHEFLLLLNYTHCLAEAEPAGWWRSSFTEAVLT